MRKIIRNIMLVKKLLVNKDKNKKEIMEILGLKQDFQLEKLMRSAPLFDEKQLESYLVLLSDLDYKIKRGKISNKLALEMFIMNICK